MGNIDLIIILTTAFLGSVGHCIGMCGGIVVAYSSTKIDQRTSYLQQTSAHLAYNFGRVTTYAILGAAFGYVGQVVAFTPTTKGVLFVITGMLMILAGLSLIGNLKFLNSAEWSVSKYAWYQNSFRALMSNKSYLSFYLLGLLNGIIPCGLVYSFAIFAASTADPLAGALVMATFGLATIPALFFLGFLTKFLQKGSLRGTMMKLAALLVILYGGITLNKGYKFIVHPQIMKERMDKMHEGSTDSTLTGQFNGMKCAPGKCG
ncbi:MAG: sulfite exporter TauE/SafE family protein [Sulfurovum sp.]|uniref:sulfite exporter TauE/SafE family protein n=1 Tax=Sulfurovum sp. TaxID=1969726 RepID=UPI00286814B3|nr:sulfite exporter TauE/SafE family protein [Sulfurovum sp.]MCO4845000.1 sulfite exporter TauE/SafE family protein [Sulfurovum sp.]